MVSRRHIFALGTVAGAAAVPVMLRQAGASANAAVPPVAGIESLHSGHSAATGTSTTPAAVAAMPIPPTLRPARSTRDTDYYQLTAAPATAELVPGLSTPVLAYGGSYVGPTIRARSGRRVVVTHANALDMPTALHLHGGHTAAADDGHPMDVIEPGASRRYTYPNCQPGATLWYHDHAHHMESEHVYRGLHGFYLLEGRDEKALRLPSGAYDIPIMLTDANIDATGALVYTANDFSGRSTVLVNGRPQPYLAVAARKYRLRLLDAANLRFFTLSLNGGEPMVQIATDGGLLPAPVPVSEVPLSPGERAEVVVDFSRYPVGSQVYLTDGNRQLMRFDVVREGHGDRPLPQRLRPLPPLPPATATRDVALGINLAIGAFAINNQAFDPDRVDALIRRGSTEIWTLTNTDGQFGIPHNLHLHLVQFRVLDRNGVPPRSAEAGLKDTVTVAPGETVRIQATFADYLGRFVYHCHMLDHSALGMMAQMEIVE
jgi:spore coat protein A